MAPAPTPPPPITIPTPRLLVPGGRRPYIRNNTSWSEADSDSSDTPTATPIPSEPSTPTLPAWVHENPFLEGEGERCRSLELVKYNLLKEISGLGKEIVALYAEKRAIKPETDLEEEKQESKKTPEEKRLEKIDKEIFEKEMRRRDISIELARNASELTDAIHDWILAGQGGKYYYQHMRLGEFV